MIIREHLSMSKSFILNGKETLFEPGQFILDAARNGGIKISTLCYLKGSTPTCACSTPVTPDMDVLRKVMPEIRPEN
jgi:predicted molibdopterin-dependent oxidoreductase YjgC